MAQRVEVILTDDIDGSNASETLSFGVDNVVYEIDLSTENAAKLREALATFVEHARRQSPSSTRARRRGALAVSSPRRARDHSARIREWAKEQGHKVNDRGRIPGDIEAKFLAANPRG